MKAAWVITARLLVGWACVAAVTLAPDRLVGLAPPFETLLFLALTRKTRRARRAGS